MNRKKRIVLLGVTILGIVTLVLGLSFFLTYKTVINGQKTRLMELAKSQARLVETFASSEPIIQFKAPEQLVKYALTQVQSRHSNFEGFGADIEYIIGYQKGDSIYFSSTMPQSASVSEINKVEYNHPVMGKPFGDAFDGISNTLLAPGMQDELVLCAYEPVLISNMEYALIVKAELFTLFRPYIDTAIVSALLSIFTILAALFLYFKIGLPLVKDIATEEEKFHTLFHSASEGFLVTEDDGKIHMSNPAIHKLLGYTAEELEQMEIAQLIPKSIYHQFSKFRSEYNSNPVSQKIGESTEWFLLSKEKKEIPVEMLLNNFSYKNQNMTMVLIQNVTNKKLAEKKLKEYNKELEEQVTQRTKELDDANSQLIRINEKLKEEVEMRRKAQYEVQGALIKEKELNEMKSRFVSLASHEFRTPLSTILSSATLLKEYQDGSNPEKLGKHINRITSSVSNMNTILNDFLSLEKLDLGIVENKPIEFNIQDFCEEIKEEMKAITKNGQEISYNHTGELTSVYLDKHLLKNVLINLVSNAIKYSSENKPIVVCTNQNNGHVNIEVRDKGIGIPYEDQNMMFKRFFRAKNATSVQGTGLGLNIVNKYIQMMNGSITFESKEGEGTTFHVELPTKI